MKNRWQLRACLLLVVSMVASMTVSVAAAVGTAEDPLVTLSYLQQTFMDKLMGNVNTAIAQRDANLNAQIDQKIADASGDLSGGDLSGGAATQANVFTVVTLLDGQVLTGDIGCEVMLRVGSAVCVTPSSPGLIDQTDGTILQSGDPLEKNHLCMMTIEDRGVQATAVTTKLMVRGSYTVV